MIGISVKLLYSVQLLYTIGCVFAYMLVIYSIIGFILTGCEEFINHIKKKKR